MSWTAPAFLDEMQSRLENEIGDVTVYTAPVNTLKAKDNIVFVGVTGEQEWASLGANSRDDNYSVETGIFVARGGHDDATAKKARERATELTLALFDVLLALVRDTEFAAAIGANQLIGIGVSRLSIRQGREQKARWCEVGLEIQVKARI